MQNTEPSLIHVILPTPSPASIMQVLYDRKVKEEGYNFRTKGQTNFRLGLIEEIIQEIESKYPLNSFALQTKNSNFNSK